ncbi:MAG: hypothetical protein MJZ66_04455 [Bacteroidales bacterium]|nr:hypothetical protein [Bacteroidales bacterium]
MKKLIIPAVLCCALMACGGAKTNSESADSKTDASATEAAAKTEASAPKKSQMADFEKGDYKIYALRGKVSKVTYEYDYIAFNAEGQVIDDESFLRVGKDGMENNIVRGANGNIISIDVDEEEMGTFLTYNSKGLLERFVHTTDESEYEKVFTYNADDELVSDTTKYTYYFDSLGYETTCDYTILERDSHGNWTKAKCHTVGKPDEGEPEEVTKEISRKITYFD